VTATFVQNNLGRRTKDISFEGFLSQSIKEVTSNVLQTVRTVEMLVSIGKNFELEKTGSIGEK
jgi:hypothetical protein